MRKNLVVVAIAVLCASLAACSKKNLPTAPTSVAMCEDVKATNNGGPLPCKYPDAPLPSPICTDQKAINYLEMLPCRYPPEGEVHLGFRTGFRDFKPGDYVPVDLPVMGYSGSVEARVVLDTPGAHLIRLALIRLNNTVIREVAVEVTSRANIRLPFDGLSAIKPRIINANKDGRTISGSVDFFYIADR